jgi:hypothetical protein
MKLKVGDSEGPTLNGPDHRVGQGKDDRNEHRRCGTASEKRWLRIEKIFSKVKTGVERTKTMVDETNTMVNAAITVIRVLKTRKSLMCHRHH